MIPIALGHPRHDTCTANGSRFNFKDTFEVLTGKGPNEQRFTVHRELFTRRSSFTEAASSSRWNSGNTKPVDLTEHEPEVFASYMQCVYLGSVTEPEVPELVDGYYFGALIALYLLADKLQDIITMNLVVDEILRVSGELLKLPCEFELTMVYESTVAGNPLRKLCRDYYVYEAPPASLETIHEGAFPLQFLQDVVLEFERLAYDDEPNGRRDKVDCVDREKCYYDQHDDEHPKCK
jgi:hypothetical protein